MAAAGRLNERAAGERSGSLWHVDDGWALFAGPLGHNAPHAHSIAVYLAGLYDTFRLRVGGGDWRSCRSAVIPAGTPYEFDAAGSPLGVLYLEPSVAGPHALAALCRDADEVDGALVGRRDASSLRAHFEARPSAMEVRAAMRDVIDCARRHARRHIDDRIARTLARLEADAPQNLSAAEAAAVASLSASRFQHVFTAEVGVPFRRYRGWQRLRVAIRAAAEGQSLTAAAYAAGFADQAHFTRAFRTTFGAPPSRGL